MLTYKTSLLRLYFLSFIRNCLVLTSLFVLYEYRCICLFVCLFLLLVLCSAIFLFRNIRNDTDCSNQSEISCCLIKQSAVFKSIIQFYHMNVLSNYNQREKQHSILLIQAIITVTANTLVRLDLHFMLRQCKSIIVISRS
jgi:hypothetical protein